MVACPRAKPHPVLLNLVSLMSTQRDGIHPVAGSNTGPVTAGCLVPVSQSEPRAMEQAVSILGPV